MRAIIIDDEKHCREGLAILLSRHCPGMEVLEQCGNAKAAIKAIRTKPSTVRIELETEENRLSRSHATGPTCRRGGFISGDGVKVSAMASGPHLSTSAMRLLNQFMNALVISEIVR